ncbi:uncharacterized protein LOC123561923 [Mercenaria mercenaria]|uniref:uncharacterized protein LOC123561923 n=1 Tax=Mercenaria mercenaria TaxID=6596 RepID=UPI00234E6D1E|nr:uncharacterized protein LOC123561923 [Mercenaria mercenaria]
MSKKSFINRLESKKKKAAAFIQLINSDESYIKAKEASKMQDKGSTSGSGTQHSDKQNTSSGQERSLSDEMFAEYKKMMREKQKAAMLKPKVFLTVDELTRDDPVQTDIGEVKVAPPLFMADVQHLLLYALQGKDASIKPRWCRLVRVGKVSKVVAVVLDSLSSEEFKKYPESLPTLVQAFDMRVEMVSPLQYGSSVREDIMNVPISITQLKKKGLLEKKGPSKKNRQAVEKNPNSRVDRQLWATAKTLKSLAENPLKSFHKEKLGQKRKRSDDDGDDNDSKRVKPDDDDDDDNDSKIVKPDDDDDNDSKIVKPDDDDDNDSKRVKPDDDGMYDDVVSTYEMDNYDRRWLMLNTAQMICEGIPTPIKTGNKRYKDYVFSKRKYKEVTDKSPLFAVDCEMVQTRASMMDLARVSFVDENLQVVYDSFVKPWAPVTNYVTQFSGITKEILDPVTTRLQDVQWVIQTYLPPDAILCGQSICGDLASMKIFHPYVIDTSVIYNLTGNRRVKSGLKRLSSIFLRKGIQEGHEGHNSVEDAQATMELVLLKLRNNIEFGDISMLEPDLSDSVNGSIANTPNTSDGVNNPDEDDNKPIEEDTENNSRDTDVTDTVDDDTSPTREITEKRNENTNAKSVMETENEQKGSENVTDVAESGCNQSDNKDATLETDKATSDKLSGQCESSNLTKTLTSHNRENSDIWKRRLFFQNEGSKFIENFLHRIQNQRLQRREGAIIDEPSSVNLYPQSLPIITCKKDKDSERQTLEKIKDVGFCFTHLYGYKNYLKENQLTNQSNDDEETKKCLWKLDRRFWKIMMGLPSNSLFVVILPGREENGNVYSAMTFAKIT